MTVNVNIGGTMVPVEVDESQIKDLRTKAVQEFADSIIMKYICALTHKMGEELNSEEEQEVLESIRYHYSIDQFEDEFVESLVTGQIETATQAEIKAVIDDRAKFYRVTMRATQEFDIWVKAVDQWSAEEYASELGYHELSDYLEDYNTEFEPVGVDPVEHDSTGNEDYFDSTE